MLLSCCLILAMASQLPVWEFGATGDPSAWTPAANITSPSVVDGRLRFSIPDSIGYYACSTPDFHAEPYQCIVIRLKASRPGEGNLLWSGERLPYCSWDRRAPFQVKKSGWQTIVVFPFWQSEGTIRQLRLDLYGPASFEIDSVRIVSWANAKPQQEQLSWELRKGIEEWRVNPDSDCFFAPPISAKLESGPVVSVKLRSDVASECAVVYSHEAIPGPRRQSFRVRPGERIYNITLTLSPSEIGAGKSWKEPITAIGLQIPPKAQSRITVQSVSLTDKPTGPPDLHLRYLGFENAVNRAGKPCRVAGEITNTGGATAENAAVTLVLPKGLRLAEGEAAKPVSVAPMTKDPVRVIWSVIAESPGAHTVQLRFDNQDVPPAKAQLRFLQPVTTTTARYVPRPQPVETDTELMMYYFPGWEVSERYDYVRRDAPTRKPWLGYYDVSKPEVVDWQIKAAVENGIGGFVVDWYWWNGAAYYTEWIDAYAKAKYRDYLKVYMMWCNHIGTHTVDDLRKMTQYCIDNYFHWKSYYRLNGKPVLGVYEADRLRAQLGSEGIKKAFDACEAVAKEAGYPGITFVESGMRMMPSPEISKSLHAEGYSAYMTYHDNLLAYGLAPSSDKIDYADVVRTALAAWEAKRQTASGLTYIPLVETGWDPRCLHGEGPQTMIIRNRTPDLFEELLRKAKKYNEAYKPPFVLLGPANEWGEGSYIEPCVEYDFDMYERVRKVFGKGDPAGWPVNLAPSDVGLGPYDYPPVR